MLTEGMIIGDRYEVISKVGSGGMADVYKAMCHRLNRNVAIKVLKQEYSSDKNFVTKFRGEAQSVAGLSHPNIVNVFDVGEDNGLYYIVMELVEGITLKKFIERKGKLAVKEAVGIAIQIAQGMEAAHDNHIIHRDIKPQNIIISKEGKVKVTDFGIAKAATSNTITSNAMGSVHYISPEQARGGYSDEKSDIYSLGVTLYEMLSGKMPFAGDNTVSVALLHIQEEAVPLRELDPSIPVSVERIVQKCMQKKPERRYLSASELIQDLKRAISDPDGDFVQIPAVPGVNDSPTINLSDEEISHIKAATRFSKDVPESASEKELYEEEEEESDMDPKMQKIIIGLSVGAIVILAIVIITIIVKGFGMLSGGKNPDVTPPDIEMDGNGDQGLPDPDEDDDTDVVDPDPEEPVVELETVPDVVGRTRTEATSDTVWPGKLVYKIETEDSDTVEADKVIRTDPAGGEQVDINTTVVIIYVSAGAKPIDVPYLVGRLEAEAEKLISDAGFKVKRDYEFSNDIEAGRVTRTIPEGNSKAPAGSDVLMYISRGPEKKMTTVPDLLNLTEAKAKTALTDAKLKYEGSITYTHSEDVKKGNVITQDTTVGSSVEEGTVVGFSVSLGPEPITYTYLGSVTIDFNPLVDEMESAEIILRMDQSGADTKVIYDGVRDYGEFPFSVEDIEGISEEPGLVTMFVDGTLVEQVWTMTFTKVKN